MHLLGHTFVKPQADSIKPSALAIVGTSRKEIHVAISLCQHHDLHWLRCLLCFLWSPRLGLAAVLHRVIAQAQLLWLYNHPHIHLYMGRGPFAVHLRDGVKGLFHIINPTDVIPQNQPIAIKIYKQAAIKNKKTAYTIQKDKRLFFEFQVPPPIFIYIYIYIN